jgi:hypothetical protein
MSEPVLTLHVKARPMRIAGALRRYMDMRGFAPVAPGSGDVPAIAFTLFPPGESGLVAIRPQPPEQIEDHLGAYLSQELRSTCFAVVTGADLVAVRRWTAGNLEDRFGFVAGNVTEPCDADWAEAIALGRPADAVLAELGLTHLDGEGDTRRAIEAGFAPRTRAGGGAVLDVDPLLSCPECGAPMVSRTSARGTFFGCSTFPACNGTLSAAAAAKLRAQRSE